MKQQGWLRMEKINTDYKRRTWKILAKLKMRKNCQLYLFIEKGKAQFISLLPNIEFPRSNKGGQLVWLHSECL